MSNSFFNTQYFSDIYEHRVIQNGMGDIAARCGLFKLAFRVKLNNLWTKHGSIALDEKKNQE